MCEQVPLSAVTHADVGKWVRRMSESGLSPSTGNDSFRRRVSIGRRERQGWPA
jgi:hypothetical protein